MSIATEATGSGGGAWRLSVGDSFALFNPDDHDVAPTGRKAQAILTYLAVGIGVRVRREKLIELLWGDRFDAQARLSLRQSLAEIRRSVGSKLVSSDRQYVWIEAGVLQIVEGEGEPFACLTSISPEFDEWLRIEREVRSREIVSRLREDAKRALQDDRASDALSLTVRMRQLDPYGEDWLRLAMEAEYQCGRASAIETMFTEFSETVKRELGIAPTTEIRAVHDRLIALLTHQSTDSTAHSVGVPSGSPVASRDGSSTRLLEQGNGYARERPLIRVGSWPGGFIAAVVLVVAVAAAFKLQSSSVGTVHFRGGAVAIHRFEALSNDQPSKVAAALADESLERVFSTNFIETLVDWSARPKAVARADFGLRGSVSQDREGLTITSDVLDGRTGRTLWSTKVTGPPDASRQLGDKLAIRLADVLRCSIYTKRRIPAYDSAELLSRILRFCETDRLPDFPQMPNVARKLVEAAPKSAQAHAYLANALAISVASPAEVNAEIRKTLALDPRNGPVRFAMGTIANPAIDLATRERYFHTGIRLDPDFLWNRVMLGDLWMNVGRIEDARNLYQHFLADYPLNYLMRMKLGFLLAEAGDMNAAREQFELARANADLSGGAQRWMIGSFGVRAELLYGDVAHVDQWMSYLPSYARRRPCIIFALKARQSGAIPSAATVEDHCEDGDPFLGLTQGMFGHVHEALRAPSPTMGDLRSLFGWAWVFERGFERFRQHPDLIPKLVNGGVPQYWLKTGKFPDYCSNEHLPYSCLKVAENAVFAA